MDKLHHIYCNIYWWCMHAINLCIKMFSSCQSSFADILLRIIWVLTNSPGIEVNIRFFVKLFKTTYTIPQRQMEFRCKLPSKIIGLYTGWPKKLVHFVLYALTSSNIEIFKLISLSESGEHFVIILSLKIPPHLKCVAALPCEIPDQCLKSNNWRPDDFCTNTF